MLHQLLDDIGALKVTRHFWMVTQADEASVLSGPSGSGM